MEKPGLRPFLFILAVLLATACGGRVYVVSSLRLPHTIVVDGNIDDWSGALSHVEKDQLFVGFVNDHSDLFICMTKEMSIGRGPGRMGGWTVWFDPSGGSKKTLGIRTAPPSGPPEGRPSEDGAENLEILGPRENILRILSPEEAAKEGLEVRTGLSGGSFVLEIRIPLEASAQHPFAVGAGLDGPVGVGFFSNPLDRKDKLPGLPGGGGIPGAGGIGAMGGPSGMRGAMPPNMNPNISKDVEVWTRVRFRQSDQPGRSTVLGLISE